MHDWHKILSPATPAKELITTVNVATYEEAKRCRLLLAAVLFRQDKMIQMLEKIEGADNGDSK